MNFSPRGYAFENCFKSRSALVTLHRPPPDMRTLLSSLEVFSKIKFMRTLEHEMVLCNVFAEKKYDKFVIWREAVRFFLETHWNSLA
jgi:hypothetical protein